MQLTRVPRGGKSRVRIPKGRQNLNTELQTVRHRLNICAGSCVENSR